MLDIHRLSLLALAAAASATTCPPEFTAVGDSCYRITEPARHADCDALCGASATLACLAGLNESVAVGEGMFEALPHKFVWIGQYQYPYDTGKKVGWDHCTSGELPSTVCGRAAPVPLPLRARLPFSPAVSISSNLFSMSRLVNQKQVRRDGNGGAGRRGAKIQVPEWPVS